MVNSPLHTREKIVLKFDISVVVTLSCVPFIKKSTKSQQFQDFTFYVVERIDCTVGQPTDDLMMMMMLLMLILEAMH